jgi:hypothetical protein
MQFLIQQHKVHSQLTTAHPTHPAKRGWETPIQILAERVLAPVHTHQAESLRRWSGWSVAYLRFVKASLSIVLLGESSSGHGRGGAPCSELVLQREIATND